MFFGRFASSWSAQTMQRIAICLAALAALMLSPPPLRASPIDASQIIVFGDSLSDVGNAYRLTGSKYPPSPPYLGGRFSNGPLWVEQLAQILWKPPPTPSSSPAASSNQSATDFAYAGAATGPTPLGTQLGTPAGMSPFTTPTGKFITNVPSLPSQVASYISSLKGGDAIPLPASLATIWAGGNDFFDGQRDPTVPAKNIANAVATLIHAGVTNFLVLNLPDLSKTPFGLSTSAATQQGLHALTVGFNDALNAYLQPLAKMPGVHIHMVDAYGLFQRIQANPSNFDLSNVTGEGVLSGNPAAPGYLFWDDVHPTTAAGAYIALEATEALGLPEPSSTTLLASGLLGLLGYGWRRRKAA